MKGKYTGWSVRGRPFTPQEFKESYLKSDFRGSYGKYLQEFGRQYRIPKQRKYL